METLKLYKQRQPYEVELKLKGKLRTFKIPNELTIEESERLMEAEIQLKELAKQEVNDKTDEEKKLDQYFNVLYQYLLILFSKHQPEITKAEDIKQMMTQQEAVSVLEFFKKKRFLHLLGADEEEEKTKKKKPKSNEEQLEELRQGITFLVVNGFSLLEVKKLYIDEYIEYSNSLIYIKEKRGEMEKGTYNKIKGKKADTVGNLKSQLFNIKSNGKQKSSR